MPLLAFACDTCGHVFEALTTQEAAGQIVCEECGGEVSRHYQGKSLFGLLQKSEGCGPMGDCGFAGTGCGGACRH